MILKYPIIPITFFAALGIFAGSYFEPSAQVVVILFTVALVLLILGWWHARRVLLQKPWFAVSGWLMALALGLAVQYLHYGPNHNIHYTHSIETERPLIRGVITERLKPNEFSEKYFLELRSLNHKPVTGRILVTMPKDDKAVALRAGDVLLLAAAPQPITTARNPFQFDYAAYMARQGVFHQIKLRDNYVVAGYEKSFNSTIQQLRDRLVGSFGIQNFKPETQQVINALMFGQRQDMDKQTTDNYTSAGVVHILAISGLHFSLLFFAFSRLFAPLKRIPKTGKPLYFVAILLLMWLFAFITGLPASVVRAVVMFTIILIGQALNRRANIYNSLAFSMLILLIVRPSFLFDVGFQLSYLAVFSIVWLQPVYTRLPRSKYKALQWAKDTMAISLIAQLGVLPLTLYYFNQFPLLFLLANIVVIPLSNIVLALGLVTLLLNFTIPAVAIWTGRALELSITVMNGFIAWVASFEKLVLKNIPFNLLLNILLYGVIISLGFWLYRNTFKRAVAVLGAIVVFQVAYIITSQKALEGEELVVFHNYETSLLAQKSNAGITVYSNDSLAGQNRIVTDYCKAGFNPKFKVKPLKPLLWYKGKKILVVDSLAVYTQNLHPDIVVLTHNSKVNLQRMLAVLKPAQVVADGTSYKSIVARWAATCQKQNIPFHATAEKGYYIVK